MNIHLASYNQCTGCGACAASCAKEAITFDYDKNGFLRPSIDCDRCVGCGLCEKNCPVLHPEKVEFHSFESSNSYTSWTKDVDLCKQSTSGGVFSQLAIDFLKQENSYVYGAHLNEDNTCYHIEISNPTDIYKIIGTKYLPSNASAAIRKAKQRLKDGGKVLFSGTPCQIAGLYSCIPQLYYKKLYTIEVICHGMPSKLLSDITCRYYGGDHVISYRDKSNGWERGVHVLMKLGNTEVYDTKSIFCLSEVNNLSCYRCRYAQLKRISDVTLGDNWNLYSKKRQFNEWGMSLVLVNTSHGNDLFIKNHIEILPFEKKDLNSPLLFLPNKYRYYLNISRWIGKLSKENSFVIKLIKHHWKKNLLIMPYAILLKISRCIYARRVKKEISNFKNNFKK